MAYFFPKTKSGKWAAVFIALFFSGFILLQTFVAAGQTGGDGFPGNLQLFVPGVFSGLCGLTALVFGLVALFREKERGILNTLIIFLGLLLAFFIFGEFLSPH